MLNRLAARAVACAVIAATFPLAVQAQSVPVIFQNAEISNGGSTPQPPDPTQPLPYNFFNYNSSSGTRASAGVSTSNTFGVSTEASTTSGTTSINAARLELGDKCTDCAVISNQIGGSNGIIEFETTSLLSNESTTSSGATSMMQSSTSTTTSMSGVSTNGALEIKATSADGTTGSLFTSESSSNNLTEQGKASGGAKAFLSTGTNVDTQQSSFTSVFLQTF